MQHATQPVTPLSLPSFRLTNPRRTALRLTRLGAGLVMHGLVWLLVVPLHRLIWRLLRSTSALSGLLHLLPREALPHAVRLAGARLGEGLRFDGHLQLINLHTRDLRHLEAGDGCFFGHDVLLDLATEIRLGRHVALAPRASVFTHASPAEYSLLRHCPYPPTVAPVVIEDDAWIGAGAVLLPGVRIGRAAMVAAGSVVTQDVPPHTLVAGTPARPVKRLRGVPDR